MCLEKGVLNVQNIFRQVKETKEQVPNNMGKGNYKREEQMSYNDLILLATLLPFSSHSKRNILKDM